MSTSWNRNREFNNFFKDEMTYKNNPKPTAVSMALESLAPVPSIDSRNHDITIDGIVKSALVMESQPARLSCSLVIDTCPSFTLFKSMYILQTG